MEDNSIKHILENPDKYDIEQVDLARFMADKLEAHRGLEYNGSGFNMINEWFREYLEGWKG